MDIVGRGFSKTAVILHELPAADSLVK